MTDAEIASAMSGGKWNFRHCNGRFCGADQVVKGTCGGECRTGQKPAKPVTPTKGGQKGKRIGNTGNPVKPKSAKQPPKSSAKSTASKPAAPKRTAAERRAADRRRAAQLRGEWDGYEDSAYQSAESATRGHMERRGASSSIQGVYWPRGRRPWSAASKDLVRYWDGGGMVPVTLTEYKSGRRAPQGRPWTDPDDRPKKKGGRRG